MRSLPLTRNHYVEKIIAFFFAGAALLLLSPKAYLNLFVVMGQAHFASAYLYQYKAGKIRWKYVVSYSGVLALFFYAALTWRDQRLVAAIASVYFVHHFWVDERHLLGDRPHPFFTLESGPFFIMYVGYIFYSLRYFDVRGLVAASGAAGIAVYLFLLYWSKIKFTSRNAYFLLLNLGIFGVCISGAQVGSEYLMGFIILMHYSNWYTNYYFKFSNNKPLLHSYLRNIFVINAAVFTAYLLFKSYPTQLGFLNVFFSQYFFYVWATIHILFTTRAKDLGFWRMSKPAEPALSYSQRAS